MDIKIAGCESSDFLSQVSFNVAKIGTFSHICKFFGEKVVNLQHEQRITQGNCFPEASCLAELHRHHPAECSLDSGYPFQPITPRILSISSIRAIVQSIAGFSSVILFLSIMSLFRNLTAKIQKSPDISHARRGKQGFLNN